MMFGKKQKQHGSSTKVLKQRPEDKDNTGNDLEGREKLDGSCDGELQTSSSLGKKRKQQESSAKVLKPTGEDKESASAFDVERDKDSDVDKDLKDSGKRDEISDGEQHASSSQKLFGKKTLQQKIVNHTKVKGKNKGKQEICNQQDKEENKDQNVSGSSSNLLARKVGRLSKKTSLSNITDKHTSSGGGDQCTSGSSKIGKKKLKQKQSSKTKLKENRNSSDEYRPSPLATIYVDAVVRPDSFAGSLLLQVRAKPGKGLFHSVKPGGVLPLVKPKNAMKWVLCQVSYERSSDNILLSPTEKDADFSETVLLLKQATPVVNICREIDPLAFSLDFQGSKFVFKATSEEDHFKWTSNLSLIFRILVKEHTLKLVFGSSETTKTQKLHAASIAALVNDITNPKQRDYEFCQSFLLTYGYFSNGNEIFRHLEKRYCNAGKEVGSSDVRGMVLEYILTWVCQTFDFIADPALQDQCRNFLKTASKQKECPREQIKNLLNVLDRKVLETRHLGYQVISMLGPIYELERKRQIYSATVVKPPAIPSRPPPMTENSSFLNHLSLEILSQQWTLLCFSVFHSITPREFFRQRWTKKELRSEYSPNITELSTRFNKFSQRIVREILCAVTPLERCMLIQKAITLAHQFLIASNFHGMMSVMGGLSSAAVTRLVKSWKEVPSETMRLYREMDELTSCNGNYTNLRAAVHSSPLPCLPFLGVFLQDLVFIDDGNKDVVIHDEQELINWNKFSLMSHVLHIVRQFQKIPYLFPDVYWLQRLLNEIKAEDENTLYEISLQVEPRAP